MLEIFNDHRLDTRVANEAERITRRAALRVVIDGHVRQDSSPEAASAVRTTNTRSSTTPTRAPASCATMKPGASCGRMPANVSVSDRPTVMAGFANEVDAVNQ